MPRLTIAEDDDDGFVGEMIQDNDFVLTLNKILIIHYYYINYVKVINIIFWVVSRFLSFLFLFN